MMVDLLLSSEPFPFKANHVYRFKGLLSGLKVFQVDGELCFWYGSRFVERMYSLLEKHRVWTETMKGYRMDYVEGELNLHNY